MYGFLISLLALVLMRKKETILGVPSDIIVLINNYIAVFNAVIKLLFIIANFFVFRDKELGQYAIFNRAFGPYSVEFWAPILPYFSPFLLLIRKSFLITIKGSLYVAGLFLIILLSCKVLEQLTPHPPLRYYSIENERTGFFPAIILLSYPVFVFLFAKLCLQKRS